MRHRAAHRLARVLVALTLAALAVAAGCADAASGPQMLYQRLLTRPFPKTRLPAGFYSAVPTKLPVTAAQRKRGMVGRVALEVDGPLDEQDSIVYSVYATPEQARAAIGLPARSGWRREGPVPGYRQPSVVQIGVLRGTNALGQRYAHGVTLMAVAEGNVVAQGVSSLLDTPEGGRAGSARRLLAAALVHLGKLRAR